MPLTLALLVPVLALAVVPRPRIGRQRRAVARGFGECSSVRCEARCVAGGVRRAESLTARTVPAASAAPTTASLTPLSIRSAELLRAPVLLRRRSAVVASELRLRVARLRLRVCAVLAGGRITRELAVPRVARRVVSSVVSSVGLSVRPLLLCASPIARGEFVTVPATTSAARAAAPVLLTTPILAAVVGRGTRGGAVPGGDV